MLTGIGLLLLFGFIGGKLVSKIKLPPLIGMLVVGALLGPYAFNWLSEDLLLVSQDIRTFALIIILLRAGLGINKEHISRIGSTALKLSSIPCILEGLTITGIAYYLLQFTFAEAGMLGFIIAAVSPAVVVPSMIDIKEQGLGEDKQVSTLILAGASVDDVFAITLFTLFLNLGTENHPGSLFSSLVSIPITIILGVAGGALLAGFLVYILKRINRLHTEKLLLIIGAAIIFVSIGERIGVASLLGVMVIGFVLFNKLPNETVEISKSLTGIWVFLQILLFALVGSEVNIKVALESGLIGVLIIFLGLIARSIGVWLATANSELNANERLFCIIAYTPKATVQAAIGALPLAMGVERGSEILALAVLSIVLTAPLGAIAIKVTASKLLKQT